MGARATTLVAWSLFRMPETYTLTSKCLNGLFAPFLYAGITGP